MASQIDHVQPAATTVESVSLANLKQQDLLSILMDTAC